LYTIRKFIYYDLSNLAIFFQARHNGQNYVFALLTGYRDPPAGISVNFSPIFALDLLLQLQIVGS